MGLNGHWNSKMDKTTKLKMLKKSKSLKKLKKSWKIEKLWFGSTRRSACLSHLLVSRSESWRIEGLGKRIQLCEQRAVPDWSKEIVIKRQT
mgnify:CR=1 FL=1